MSRLKVASEILDAAEVWKERCLLGGQSLFGEETIWTTEYFNELQTYFVENLEKGGGTFIDKLKLQLAPASPQTKRLCAEIEWIYLLISSAVKRVSKLDRIRTIWSWSEEDLPEDLPLLGAVLDKGMINTGTAFNVHKHLEYVFIISMMQDWCVRSVTERESLLADPWKFATWLDKQADANKRQFRHILLFLLFRDCWESP